MADVFRWVSVREACLYCKIQRMQMSKEMIFFFDLHTRVTWDDLTPLGVTTRELSCNSVGATTLFDIPTTRIVNFVICLPTEHLVVLKISLNCVRAFQMTWGVLVFRERGKPEYPKKNLS